jgi:hypothetical protein
MTDVHLLISDVEKDLEKRLSIMSMANGIQMEEEERMIRAYCREDAIAAVREAVLPTLSKCCRPK